MHFARQVESWRRVDAPNVSLFIGLWHRQEHSQWLPGNQEGVFPKRNSALHQMQECLGLRSDFLSGPQEIGLIINKKYGNRKCNCFLNLWKSWHLNDKWRKAALALTCQQAPKIQSLGLLSMWQGFDHNHRFSNVHTSPSCFPMEEMKTTESHSLIRPLHWFLAEGAGMGTGNHWKAKRCSQVSVSHTLGCERRRHLSMLMPSRERGASQVHRLSIHSIVLNPWWCSL